MAFWIFNQSRAQRYEPGESQAPGQGFVPTRPNRFSGWAWVGLIGQMCVLWSVGLGVRTSAQDMQVGPGQASGTTIVPTSQRLHPAGMNIEIPTRPVDLVCTHDGKYAIAKDNQGLVLVDTVHWKELSTKPIPGKGGSMTGLALSPDERIVLVSDAGSRVHVAAFDKTSASFTWKGAIELPKAPVGGNAFPCGIAFLPDADGNPDSNRAIVCLSRSNEVAIISVKDMKVLAQIEVGVAPFDVQVSRDGSHAWVSNRGGRRTIHGEKTMTAPSARTPTRVDTRGIASNGSISLVDLAAEKEIGQIEVGRSPGNMCLSHDGAKLYVTNSNADTISILDTAARQVLTTVSVRPDTALPFGSMPSAIALSADGQRAFVTCAGNNAVAVLDIAQDSPAILGWIPTGWYPGAVVAADGYLAIANIKGIGSRTKHADHKGWNSHWHRGTLEKVDLPFENARLAQWTKQVRADGRVPQILRSLERTMAVDAKPVPVPATLGEPSVFEHIVYIIKENRTYDQVFGDLPKGNNDPSLCIYGRDVTPNQHALAEQFITLDNYYCNGVLSADGHSWATEGNVTPYLERSFGGFARSYTFGDDPLTYSSSGFLWDHVLAAGLSFRNYGEFNYSSVSPKASYFEVYKDWKNGTGKYHFPVNIGVENLQRYSCPDAPGWNLKIPDQIRADVVLKELDAFVKQGTYPNLVIIYLPEDHTAGTGEGHPTPRSLVADNDLAVGRIVAGLSESPFWKSMCIFVNEDDPQNGFDHVDGHRSTCLVISPYTRRGVVSSAFYNQTSVLHTIERILGIAPVNQLYALAPLMTGCFGAEPDFSTFDAIPNRVPLAEPNPKASSLRGLDRVLQIASEKMDFSVFDRVDEETLNRVLWHAAKGADARYPEAFAGAHGKGLSVLGLRLAHDGEWAGESIEPDGDDDE